MTNKYPFCIAKIAAKQYYVCLMFALTVSCNQSSESVKNMHSIVVADAVKADSSMTETVLDSSKIAPKRTEVAELAVEIEREKKQSRFSDTKQVADTLSNDIEAGLKVAQMMDIHAELPTAKVDLRYSTTDNFVGIDLYGTLNACYLHPIVVKKLKIAQQLLIDSCSNCRLLFYDCARPLAVQKKMWKQVRNTPKRHYVADPSRHSLHNYGLAVDIGIFDEGTQTALDMGTVYDFLGSLAQPRYEAKFLKTGQLSQQQVKNRRLLRYVMQQAGFRAIPNEWWHFDAVSLQYAKKHFSLLH